MMPYECSRTLYLDGTYYTQDMSFMSQSSRPSKKTPQKTTLDLYKTKLCPQFKEVAAADLRASVTKETGAHLPMEKTS